MQEKDVFPVNFADMPFNFLPSELNSDPLKDSQLLKPPLSSHYSDKQKHFIRGDPSIKGK